MKLSEIVFEATIDIPSVGTFSTTDLAEFERAIGPEARINDPATKIRAATWLASKKHLKGPVLQKTATALLQLLEPTGGYYDFYSNLNDKAKKDFRKVVQQLGSKLPEDIFRDSVSRATLLLAFPYFEKMQHEIPSHIKLADFVEEVITCRDMTYYAFNQVTLRFKNGSHASRKEQEMFVHLAQHWNDPDFSIVYDEDEPKPQGDGNDLVIDELFSLATDDEIPFMKATSELLHKLYRESVKRIETSIERAELKGKIVFELETFFQNSQIDEPFGY